MVITGPNTGVQTVTLKTLVCVHLGSAPHLPAADGPVPVCRVLRISATNSASSKPVTFSAHMCNIVPIFGERSARPGAFR
jgi:dsDNA-specific endonuclease/ATPase MutS2